jgi:iron complex outermembrane recepter protein
MSRCRMKLDVVLSLAALLLAATGAAASSLDREVQFNIPAQSLSPALIQFSNQADVQVITKANDVSGERTRGVAGWMTVGEALKQLLQETGFSYLVIGDNTVEISSNVAQAARSAAVQDGLVIAQTENVSTQTSADVSQPSQANEQLQEVIVDIPEILITGSRALNLDIRRTRDDIQPYVVFDRAVIEKSGATNVQDFLKQRLTAATNPEANSQRPTSFGNTSAITLRGLSTTLGTTQTLVLVDGRRVAGFNEAGGAQQPDLNGIPLAAIERIEVLPTTASGIYGGSATGGVINVVLRRDYQGIETSLNYGNTSRGDAETRRIDMTAGFSFEGGRTSLMLAGSYADHSDLLAGERDFLRRARALRFANAPDTFDPAAGTIFSSSAPPLGATTNLCSGASFFGFSFCTGVPLTLKNGTPLISPLTSQPTSFASVPGGYAGIAAAGDAGQAFLATAGQYNLGLADSAQGAGGARQGLLNAPTVESLIMTLRRELSHRIEAFLDVQASNNVGYQSYNAVYTSFFVPAAAPTNPFNEDIVVSTPGFGADGTVFTRLYDRKLGAGLVARLGRSWSGTVNYTWDRTRRAFQLPSSMASDPLTFTPVVEPDLVSGAIDVLRDTTANSLDFSQYLAPSTTLEPNHTTLEDATVRFSGPIASLPGGPITLATLLEHRKESFDAFVSRSFDAAGQPPLVVSYPSRWQKVASVSLEASVPVASRSNSLPGVRALDLQLAARYDDYKTLGSNFLASPTDPVVTATNKFSSTDPTIGLRYQPVQDVTLRASFGTGFLPPPMQFLVPNPSIAIGFNFFVDPRRGEVVAPDTLLFVGGNPNLGPEESESRALGVILTPRFVPGLRFSVDWSQIEKTDNIDLLTEQQAIDNEALIPGLIVRAAPGPGESIGRIVEIHTEVRNFARQEFEGYDIALEYRRDTKLGTFGFSADATRQLRNESQATPLTEVLDIVDYITGLKWKGNATLSWDRGPWSLAWTGRYFDSYRVGFPTAFGFSDFVAAFIGMQGSDRYPSQTYHDIFAGYRFGKYAAGPLSGVEVQLTLSNVFDKSPPINATDTFLGYSTWGDPRRAHYLLSLRKAF